MAITLKGEVREQVGSRAARKLRAQGRIICNIQAEGKAPIAFSLDGAEFMAARRKHEHLFDITLGKDSHAAVVRELQWDYLTDEMIHCDFQEVVRGVKIENEVGLTFIGTPAGVLNVLSDHITILSTTSDIPNSIEIKVGELADGDSVEAGQIEMPEGCTLVTPADHQVAIVSGAGGGGGGSDDDDEAAEGEGGEAATEEA